MRRLAPPHLEPGDVHVWRMRLAAACPDVVRDVLRELLGVYTGQPPASIQFELGSHGKPRLPDRRVSFSVAHTRGLALYAVACKIEVGVDVERIDPARASLVVADAFMSAAATDRLRTCRDDVRAREFFRLWTRREALLKARGTGWFDESSATAAEGDTPSGWWLRELPLGPTHAAAVAGEGEPSRVLLFDLREGSPYAQRSLIEARSEMLSHSRLHGEREAPVPAGDHLPS